MSPAPSASPECHWVVAVIASATDLYDSLPENIQRAVRLGYFALHPRLSLAGRRKMQTVDEAFVNRFFDGRAEFERYRKEFLDGRVVDICIRADETAPDGMTIYDAPRSTCAKLYGLIRTRRPDVLVETGVYNGVSTLSMLLALERNGTGTLYSIDNSDRSLESDGAGVSSPKPGSFYERGRPSCADPQSAVLPPKKEPGWLVPEDLHTYWERSTGPTQRQLVSVLNTVEEVDLFLHDSVHSVSGMFTEFSLAWEWLSDGGILLSNHVDRNDVFERFAEEHGCDHGLYDYVYDLQNPEYDEPCSCGYVVKER